MATAKGELKTAVAQQHEAAVIIGAGNSMLLFGIPREASDIIHTPSHPCRKEVREDTKREEDKRERERI